MTKKSKKRNAPARQSPQLQPNATDSNAGDSSVAEAHTSAAQRFERVIDSPAFGETDDEFALRFVSLLAGEQADLAEGFNRSITSDAPLFVGACLRTLASRPSTFTETRLGSLLVADLLRRQERNFWKRVAESPEKLQTFEIIPPLQNSVDQAIARLEMSLAFDAAKPLDKAWQNLMREASSPLTRTLVDPFLDWVLTKESMQRVIRYGVESETSLLFPVFTLFIQSASELESQLTDLGTKWSLMLADGVASMRTTIATRMEASGRFATADLTVREVQHRLPLDLPGQRFKLPIDVENVGQGVAHNPRLTVEASAGIDIDGSSIEVALGSELSTGSTRIVLAGTVASDIDSLDVAEMIVTLAWESYDGSTSTSEEAFSVRPQLAGVDWDALESLQPYSLDAVQDADDLYGRTRHLRAVVSKLRSAAMGSTFIYGQKRVGKTSLALAALSELRSDNGVATVFRSTGSIANPVPSLAIDKLSERLMDDLCNAVPSLSVISRPASNGSLAPLCEFVENAVASNTELRIAIVLDEFDALPSVLLQRSPEGDAMFRALRALSSLPQVGLVLVGGERMKLVLNGPGVELNTFASVQLDYIDRSSNWSDFVDLVRKPADGSLEFSDDAVDAIYDRSQGNPYFAKVILVRIYETCIEDRRAWVTASDVREAVAHLVSGDASSLVANSFSHYWEDYLLERGDEADAITLRRRRVMLALADALRRSLPATEVEAADLAASGSRFGIEPGELLHEADQYRQREILVEENDRWSPRLPLFADWLVARGDAEIVIGTTELEAEANVLKADQAVRVTYEEARLLAENFEGYTNGGSMSADRILAYLKQFGTNQDQRRIFRILQQVRFVGLSMEQAAARAAWELVRDNLQAGGPGWNRSNVLVTYCDGPGKSQSAIGRHFVNAMGSSPSLNLVDFERLRSKVQEGRVDAVIIIDDFVGTGQSLVEGTRRLLDEVPLAGTNCLLGVFAVTGTADGIQRVRSALDDWPADRILTTCIEELGERDKALALERFTSEAEHIATSELVRSWGERLEPKAPLGFGDCQSLTVFGRTTPNCSLPILWKRSSGSRQFEPLFPRR